MQSNSRRIIPHPGFAAALIVSIMSHRVLKRETLNMQKKRASLEDTSQHLDIELAEIVPEYHSGSALVRWLFNKRLDCAETYVQTVAPRSLVDIGCGEGQFIVRLNKRGGRIGDVWGVDLNPHVKELNGKIENCTFAQRSIFASGFQDGMFDVVVCLDVLEHIHDIEKAIDEIKRILSVRGHLITSEPVESVIYRSLRFLLKGTYSQESGPGAGKHYYNARQIDRIIRTMGFVRVRSRRVPFFPPFDLFHVNLYIKK